MAQRFTDKIAIVTGSSNGIGRATAISLASEGAKVTITGRNAERLEESRHALLKVGVPSGHINSVVADVTTGAGQDLLIDSTLKKFGKINILINNAGALIVDPEGKTNTSTGVETCLKTFQLNFQSVVEMTQKIRPHLAMTHGEIVNVSSVGAGPAAENRFPYYSAAKAALDQYSRNTAIDLIPEGIRVNIVQPGFVATGFTTAASGMSPDATAKMYEGIGANTSCIPAGYCGRPEHLASVIAFLADRKASEYIVGQTIIADGGTTLVRGCNVALAARRAE